MMASTLRGIFILLGISVVNGIAIARPAEFDHSHLNLRNHAPLTSVLGIPSQWPWAASREPVWALDWSIASHASFENSPVASLLQDGETHVLSFRYQQALGQRLVAGIEIPFIAHGGGFMDGIIDAWHELAGLNEGIRPQTPRNDLQFVYTTDGVEQFRLDRPRSGLGDLRIAVAVDTGPVAGGLQSSLIVSADLPTGSVARLTGNASADYAAGLRIGPATSGRWNWAIDVGAAWPGDMPVPELRVSPAIFYYHAGLSWQWGPRATLLAAVAGHTAPYSSTVKSLGDPAAMFSAGLRWRISDRHAIRISFSEDIRSETAPDFGVQIGVSAALSR